jgi:hypothetical protein
MHLLLQPIHQLEKLRGIEPFEECPGLVIAPEIEGFRAGKGNHPDAELPAPFPCTFEQFKIGLPCDPHGPEGRIEDTGTAQNVH